MLDGMDNADKRTWLIGLIVECPMQKTLDGCPMDELRNLPLPERMKRVKNMSEPEVDSILEYHQKCINKRENES